VPTDMLDSGESIDGAWKPYEEVQLQQCLHPCGRDSTSTVSFFLFH
jgi:hypothetical protein